ncbi:MAG: OsmC family protein [Anaerolineae bacterium]
MGTTTVSAEWTGDALHFEGTDTHGNKVPMGGDNPSPSQLMLLGLAGCTGMDVVSILQKKRAVVTGLEVRVKGTQPDDYPKPYNPIELEFIVRGQNINPKDVARAIELSEAKYCIVGQTLQTPVEIKTSFSIEGG